MNDFQKIELSREDWVKLNELPNDSPHEGLIEVRPASAPPTLNAPCDALIEGELETEPEPITFGISIKLNGCPSYERIMFMKRLLI